MFIIGNKLHRKVNSEMNREIKFRAWQKNYKKMADVVGIRFGLNFIDISMVGFNYAFGIDEVELMQYTGLLDKNGKEIYEGDIIESQYFLPSEVMFVNGCFLACDISFPDAESGDYEDIEWKVIGNIYENPNLLEVNK